MKFYQYLIILIVLYFCSANPNLTAIEIASDSTESLTQSNLDTLLMNAVYSLQADSVVKLLDRGANIEFRGWRHHQTPLLFLSQDNNGDSLFYELLRRGADAFARDKHGHTTLHLAAAHGNIRKMNTLIMNYEIGHDIPENYGRTPLHLSAKFNKPEAIKYLLENGADIDAVDSTNHTPLWYAWQSNSGNWNRRDWLAPESFEYLIYAGADLGSILWNSDDFFIGDPIVRLCEYDNPELIELALQQGAKLVDTPKRTTPLHVAVSSGCLRNVEFLLRMDLKVDALDQDGNTPLIFACGGGFVEIVKILINAGADINFTSAPHTSTIGHLSLGAVVMSPVKAALRSENLDIAELLFRKGASIEVQSLPEWGNANYTGLSLLHFMALNNNLSSVKWLLQKGADPNDLNDVGQTAAFYGVENNNAKIIRELAKYEIDFNVADIQGKTVLHYAARQGSEEAMKEILKRDINPNIVCDLGWTPLVSLVSFNSEDPNDVYSPVWQEKTRRMASALINAGASTDIKVEGMPLLEYAFDRCNQGLAEAILENGADPVMLDEDNSTLLHRIQLRGGRGWMVSLLIRFGADPNAVDNKGDTPLMSVVSSPCYSSPDLSYITALVEAGVEINFRNPDGLTAVTSAVYNSHERAAKCLLDHGALPDIADNRLCYALYTSVIKRDVPCTQVLLEGGANPNRSFPTKNNFTYLHHAASNSWFDIVRLLLKHGADPNFEDDSGNTPLHHAVLSRYQNEGKWCVEALLEAGAKTNIKSLSGATPLEIANSEGIEAIRDLLNEAAAKKE
ncbi:MAG: hypothetical protein HN356_14965 [Calditrichaeota bacterium]|nr:hypothetical protein [Calditrichota bacterium]